MASPLQFKVYSATEMVGALRYAEDAAGVVSNTPGGIIKWQGRIVWREGREEQPAGVSFDYVANVVSNRVSAIHLRSVARLEAARTQEFALP